MANENAKYAPTQWEKITAVAVAFFIVGLISFLVIRDKPFSDLNFAVFARILLSLSCAVLGAVIPGFLQVDLHKKGLAIRAGGALALFVLTFFFTPSVISPSSKSISIPKNSETTSNITANDISSLKNTIFKIGDKNFSPENLVINGDFSAHWSEGWRKNLSDKTEGSLHVETIVSSNDPSDKILHLHLDGQGAGWVEQKISTVDAKKIKDLFIEFEIKTKKEKFSSKEPIEAFFCIQFTDKIGDSLGQIIFSTADEGDFMEVSKNDKFLTMKSADSRCIIKIDHKYHAIKKHLYGLYEDCFSMHFIDSMASIDLAIYLQASQDNQDADIYVDNIKMYYKD